MKKVFVLFLIFVMILAFTGCSTTNAPVEETDLPNEEVGVTEENPLEGQTLKVLSAIGGRDTIFPAFTEATGIQVEFLDMSSGEVLARLEAEGGRPMADVWFGGGVDSFIAAKDKGLLEKYVSPDAATINDQYKDADGYWTGFSLVINGFIVNYELLEEKGIEIPTKWSDLTNPALKDEILMADPAISGTNYATVNALLQEMGEDAGWEYFKELTANIPYYAQRGGEPANKVAAGEVMVGLIPMTGQFLSLEETSSVKGIYPEDGIVWLPAPIAIFKNAENIEVSQAFVDWVLSIEGQEIIRDADPRIMARPEVAYPPLMEEVPLDKLLATDFEVFGDQRDEILEIWNERFGK